MNAHSAKDSVAGARTENVLYSTKVISLFQLSRGGGCVRVYMRACVLIISNQQMNYQEYASILVSVPGVSLVSVRANFTFYFMFVTILDSVFPYVRARMYACVCVRMLAYHFKA